MLDLRDFSTRREYIRKPVVRRDDEASQRLTGFVQGLKASSNEEWFAMALDVSKIRYDFQYQIRTQLQIPSQAKLVDFMLWLRGLRQPIEIDGPFHDTYGKKAKDQLRDSQLLPILLRNHMRPIIRIHHTKCYDFESALKSVREL